LETGFSPALYAAAFRASTTIAVTLKGSGPSASVELEEYALFVKLKLPSLFWRRRRYPTAAVRFCEGIELELARAHKANAVSTLLEAET
jgi:hypothetical protein